MTKENPVKALVQACGVTSAEFLRESGLSRSTYTNIINGAYPEISDRQFTSVVRLCLEKGVDHHAFLRREYGEYYLADAYIQWRKDARQEHLEDFFVAPRPGKGAVSPFARYVEDTAGGPTAFSKRLKVSPAAVYRYSTGATRRMPGQIREALVGVGYGSMIPNLEALQDAWREAA